MNLIKPMIIKVKNGAHTSDSERTSRECRRREIRENIDFHL